MSISEKLLQGTIFTLILTLAPLLGLRSAAAGDGTDQVPCAEPPEGHHLRRHHRHEEERPGVRDSTQVLVNAVGHMKVEKTYAS